MNFTGKLWETVQKQITSHFQECLHYQPALIVIDDMDDLCHLNSEPNLFADMSKVYLRYFHCIIIHKCKKILIRLTNVNNLIN